MSSPTGYRLSLTEDQVDSSAVLLSASASARHSRDGDHAAALAHAEAGLALWEGAAGGDPGPYDTVPHDPVAALWSERASTYRSLVRARALALARLGRRAEAVEALTDVMRERPRDEEVLLELLRCEAATAGPSQALATYDAYRRALREELGTDPGPALQAAHQHLLQGETPAVRHGIPHEPNPLLGREDDIAAVANLLRTSRVTSIVGAGGLGKTRLAHVVSRQAQQRIGYLVALAGVAGDDDVVGEVASVLGVGDSWRTSVSHLAIPADVVAELCRHLDGLPLAVELAAARVRVMSVAEIARRLDDRFALLRGGVRDAPQRHRALHAVVDWSWNLLQPAGQAALRALSIFPGGFTADAARALLGDREALQILEHLVDQSLLKAYRVGLPGQVVAGDSHLATVGADQRGENLNRGGLAGTVGAEQREDRARRNVQVDAIEHDVVAERLAQPACSDRWLYWVSSHGLSVRSASFTAVAPRFQVLHQRPPDVT